MNLKRYSFFLSLFIVLTAGVISCSKMDSTYRGFLTGGEIVYTGKVDSVKTYPGNNRINLSMLLISDPKITKVKLFWNNGTGVNSTEKEVQRTSGVDTVRFSLNNMAEGTYTFNIYTYDNDGHQSVKSDVIGNVYGEKYISSLYNRSLKSISYIGSSKARLIWYGPSAQMIGQQIKYTDSLGNNQLFVEPVYKPNSILLNDTTILTNFTKGNSFEYRTLYKPVPESLDTFYSQYQSVQVL